MTKWDYASSTVKIKIKNRILLQEKEIENIMGRICLMGKNMGIFLKTLPCQEPFYLLHAAAAAKSLQSCLTLCDPIDGSPSGSIVPGILQARTLEWVAISFSNAWKWKVKGKLLSRVRLFETPRTAAYQAPPSMGFSRQEYWSGLPLPWGMLFNTNLVMC